MSYQGIHPPDGSSVVAWRDVKRMRFERSTFGGFRLAITRRGNDEHGRGKKIISLPGMEREKENIGRVLSHYWQRDQVARRPRS